MGYSKEQLWLRFERYVSEFPEPAPYLENKVINFFDNADSDMMDNVLSSIGIREVRLYRYVNVNSHHEPWVETGEMAPSTVIPLQTRTWENRYRRT